MKSTDPSRCTAVREFFDAMRQGFLVGAAFVVLALPPGQQQLANASPSPDATGTAARVASEAPPRPRELIRLARFGDEQASAQARHVANWAFHSGDHDGKAVVVVDKQDARVFVFDPEGALVGSAPALLGSAIGDHTVPGVGDKPIAEVLPEERTTPAGRFVAELGLNARGEDVVWVDFDSAVSMHRVINTVKAERRPQRLASPTPADNRISYGCINLPHAFFEQVLSPTVRANGAIIYVLPEDTAPARLFGSYDVPNAEILALFAADPPKQPSPASAR